MKNKRGGETGMCGIAIGVLLGLCLFAIIG